MASQILGLGLQHSPWMRPTPPHQGGFGAPEPRTPACSSPFWPLPVPTLRSVNQAGRGSPQRPCGVRRPALGGCLLKLSGRPPRGSAGPTCSLSWHGGEEDGGAGRRFWGTLFRWAILLWPVLDSSSEPASSYWVIKCTLSFPLPFPLAPSGGPFLLSPLSTPVGL